MKGRPGGLTGLEWTWVALDVVLVALLVALAARGAGEPPVGPGASAAVTAGPSAGATEAGPPDVGASPAASSTSAPVAFQLPSGNIVCTLSSRGATCTIARFTYSPPAAAGCTGRTGHLVVLSDAGVEVPCVEGPTPQVTGDARQLAYGTSLTRGDFTCASGTDGVTCTQGSTGTGFRLASRALMLLPG